MTPFWWPNGRWHGKASADQPVQQHRILRADDLLQGPQLRDPRRGDGDPVLRRQVVVVGDQPHLGGVGGDRGQRRAQVAPGRWRADVGEPERRPLGSPSSPAHCTTRRRGRSVRRADTTSSDDDRSRSLQSAGSRYHAERSTRGLLGAAAPAAHHRRAGRVEVERQPGAGAVDPGPRRGAALGAGLAARSSCSLCALSAKLLEVPGPPPVTSSADRLVGMPLGPNPSRAARAERVACRCAHRSQHAGVGILFDHHVVGQAAASSGERAEVGAADRPGRLQVDHRRGSTTTLRTSPATTSQLPTETAGSAPAADRCRRAVSGHGRRSGTTPPPAARRRQGRAGRW